MAKVAVDQRKNAMKNPLATFNDKELTIEDVLASRVICDPLHLFEIVSPTSGGAAIIVASPELAKRSKNPPVWLLGAGEFANHSSITYAPSITTSPIEVAAEKRLQDGGIEAKGHASRLPLRLLYHHGDRLARGRGLLQKGPGRTVRRRA